MLHWSVTTGATTPADEDTHALGSTGFVMATGVAIPGAVWSTTVTVKVAWEELPAASTEVYTTEVVPKANTVPGFRLLVTVGCAVQLSAETGKDHVTTAVHALLAVGTTMLDGTLVQTGPWLSVTVIVKVAVAVRPLMSVAVYVTAVVPTGNRAPGLWLLTNNVPGQLSVTVGIVQETGAVHKPELAATVMLAGTLVMMGSRSTTNTQKPAVSELPLTSVAV